MSHDLKPGRHSWLQILKGAVDLDGRPLSAGDEAALAAEAPLTIRASRSSEVLLFDLA